ncbi:hypothetical protein [Pseudoroseomonas ludipueritiae]|uniref:Uncharacterized protein n=1 Tax=Pseudoroseomonas ludipueritiae TaxID=198093 RepID=A0ABR7R3G4_9PROT|nr:hypothetical protein [Pseudoroseomonas ludipueritiae]MBC9176160.1 hypothetical protein [Pseudoroseomonas ludipueritiae]
MVGTDSSTEPSRDEALALLLQSLASWLNGMGHFIAVTKREWEHASTGEHLMAQRLRQRTLDLRRDVESLLNTLEAEEQAGGMRETR